ncbi:MAG: pentapeptide repeat-containing protein, partial [Phycisphaerae bacterium]|nr:pentapeptide repeat-containing protein [Saprospiraceae bacterium]
DKRGMQIKGRNELDFSGIHLSNASISHAFAEGLNFRDAEVVGCHFEEGDFSRADFSNTVFTNTKFNKTILTDASFDGATFVNCNLNRVNLVNADFRLKEIRETVVYGLSAWDLKTSPEMKQSKLVIEKSYDLYSDIIASGKIPMMVDDIEMAQFVYYLSSHKNLRKMINILNSKGVLLLGKFKDGGLEHLYKLMDWFKKRGYTPMLFDFDRPDNLDYTETVITMAALSKFIVADLSGGSVPQELYASLSSFEKPVIVYSNQPAYSMFKDIKRKNRFSFDFVFTDEKDFYEKMETNVNEAEKGHAQIAHDLIDSHG